jgi:cell division protein ZapB
LAGRLKVLLDRLRAGSYRPVMESSAPIAELERLQQRIERLAELTRRLLDENRSLRHSQEQLVSERASLLLKNEQARSRVEAMIHRLKSLEQNA